MSWTIAMGTMLGVIGASVYYGNLTDKQTLTVLAVAAVILLIARLVLRAHKQREEDLEPWVDPAAHPYEAAGVGFFSGIGATILLASSLGVAWGLGFWTPPWTRPAGGEVAVLHEVAKVPTTPDGQMLPFLAVSPSAVVVATNYIEPMMIVDVVVNDDGEAVSTLAPNEFSLKVNNLPTELTSVSRTQHLPPFAIYFVRDISGSIMVSQPFPQMLESHTTELIRQLAIDPRRGALKIVDFAGEAVEVLPWTEELANLKVTFGKPSALDKSALDDTLIKGVDEVSLRSQPEKRLCVITDGANNIDTAFDKFGIAAHAKSKGVAIDVISLPTQSLQGEQETMLKMLAERTGGIYIDGASADIPAEIARMVKHGRKPQAAYRLMFNSERPVAVDEMIVTVSGR